MDELSILLKSKISSDISELNKSIIELSKNPALQRLSLRVNIDDSEIQLLSNQIKQFQTQMSKSLNLNVNTTGGSEGLDKFVQKFETVAGSSQKLTQEIIEFKNELGQSVKVIDDIDKETQSVYKSTQLVTDNYKKQRAEAEKLEAATEKIAQKEYVRSQTAKINAIELRNAAQVKASDADEKRATQEYVNRYTALIKEVEIRNKIAVQQAKETKAVQEQIALYKQKMLGGNGFAGELDIFSDKQKGRYDESALVKIRKDVEGLNELTPDLNNKIKQTGVEFSSLKQQAGQSGNVMTRALENAYKFLRFYLVGGALVGVVTAFRDAVSSVVDLNTSLTSLNKVADLTDTQLKNITTRAYEAGAVIGRTGRELIDSTAEWVRAGYNIEEAFSLSQQSLLLTNIGDGITDVKEASSSLIAVLKGFKMEASETAHVVDSLNEVSNKYAVDTNNLTEILKRTSGTVAQTGTSYEQLIGLATGGFESLRNAEMVASGINMITMRLKGMKEDGEEVADLIPKIQEAFNKYTDGAVSIIDKQNGGLNSTFEILQQLSTVYPTLTDEAKAYINEAVAGARQNKVLVSIMENWKNVEAATLSATNSLGSANKENEKYLNSIQGKISQFNSSTQLLWKNTINSEVIKFFVEFGTTVIKIVDKLGLLNTAIIAVAVSLLLFNKSFLTFYSMNIASHFTGLGNAVLLLARNLGIATGAATFLGTAMAMIAPIAIIMGIMAIGAGLKYLSEATERQVEAIRKLKEEYNSLTTSLEENESKQRNIIDRLQELYDLRNNNKITDVEKEELIRLENVNEELKRQINYENALRAIKGADLEKKTLELANKKTETSNVYVYNGTSAPSQALTTSEKIKEDMELMTQQKQKIDDIKKAYDEGNISIEERDKKLVDLEKTYSNLQTNLTDLVEKLKTENENYIGSTEEGTKKKAANEAVIKSVEEYIIALQGLNGITSDVSDEFQSYTQSIEEFNKAIDKAESNLKDLNQALEDNGKLTSEQILELLEKYPDLITQIEKTTTGYKIQESALEDLRQQQIKTALDSMTSQINEANNVKTTTEKKLEQYGFEIEKLKDIASAKAALAKLAQQEALNYANASSGAETNEMLREKRYSSAYKSSLASSGYAELSEYEKIVAELDELSKKKGVYTELLNDKGLGLGEGGSGGKEYTPSTEQTALKDLLDAQKISYEEYLKRLLALEKSQYSDYANKSASQIEDMLRSRNEDIAKRTEEYLSLTTEISSTKNTILENTLSSLSDEYDNGKISIDKYISSLETLRKQGGLTAEQLKNINDTIEDLSKTQQEAIQKANDDALSLYEDVNSQITDLLKKKYELEADAEEKAYNDRKDKLDKSLDDYKDYIDGVLDELDRVNATEDYNAKVSESSTKINTIDAEINKYSSAALSGDLEAINKIAELQKEKDEELKSLKEIQTDRERDLVKQTYQDNLNSYEKYVDGQQDLNDTAYDKFKEDLTLKTTDTALAMEAQNLLAQQNIGDVQNAIIALFTLTGENATVAGQLIQTQLIAKLQQAMDIQKNMNMISGGSSGNNPLGMNRSDFQTYLSNKKESESGNATPERLAQLRKENEELRKRYGIKGDIYSYSQLKGYYANGGINTETGIFALHGTPAKPEYILNTTQMNNLVKNLALNPIAMPKLNIPSLAGTGGMGSVNLGNINIYANSVDNNSVPKLVNEVMSKLKIEFNKLGVTRPQ